MEKSKTCDFSFRHYGECLSTIAESGNKIEMIHDIDFAPDNLITMASMEHDHGIRSTYFIRLHAKTYNPFALPYIAMLKKVANSLGHKMGLHFEPFYYEGMDIAKALKNEVQVLSSMLDVNIAAVSIHEPSRFGSIDPTLVPENLTYYCWDAPYYKNKKYISDSGVRWREGCMCNHFKEKNLIILTHLDHWYVNSSAENY